MSWDFPHLPPEHGQWRVVVFNAIEAVVFTGLYVASRPDRRRLLEVLRLAGATSADTAMTRSEIADNLSDSLDQLVQEGLVIVTSQGQVYLDTRAKAKSDTPRIAALIVVAIVAFCVGAWLILT